MRSYIKIKKYRYLVLAPLFFIVPFTPIRGQYFKRDSVNYELRVEPGSLFKVTKELSTASTSKVDGDVLDKTPASNLFDTMYGLLPGVHISQGSREPGMEGSWLRIRGIGSYNYGNYIVFVDGFQVPSSHIRYFVTSEIENISVFKDAASLITFGMQGANGVIWIETKRGIKSDPKVKFNVKYGIQQPAIINKPLNSYDYASLYNEAISNDQKRWTPRFSEDDLLNYKEGKGIDTDWYKEVIKQSSPYVSADINVTGGSDLAKYFVLFNFTKTNGHYNVKTDDRHSNVQLQQFNIRSNFDFKLFGFLEGKVDLGGRAENRARPAYNAQNLWNNLERYPNNIYHPINEDGSYPGSTVYPDNPLASIKELGYHSNSDRSLQVNFFLKEDLSSLLEGLYLTQGASYSGWTRGTYNVTKNYARMIDGIIQTTDKNTNYSIYDDYGTNQWSWVQLKGGIGFDKRFGSHDIKSALNYLQYKKHVDASQNSGAGNNIDYAFQNIAGRINYSFKNKYIGEIGFAVSGSDNYAKGNRYGFYPAISGAWVISNEKFTNNDIFNLLKTRLSVGKTGYDGVVGPRYPFKQYYLWTGSIGLGNATIIRPSGIDIAYTANPDIFAEESVKLNFGVDSKLWNSLSITFDAFLDKRSGIVSQDYNYMSDAYGITPPYTNAGEVTTSGLDVSISYSNSLQDLSYSIESNLSYYKDVIDYMPEVTPASTEAWRTGRSIGTQFGYESIGFYDVKDFNDDGTLSSDIPFPTFGDVQPGDIKYRDINNDHIVDERDILEIGISDYPNLSFSLIGEIQYKFLDFRVLFQGAALRDVNILNQARNKIVAFENNTNAYEIAKGRWGYYPEKGIDTRENATYPRLSTVTNNNNYRDSSFWIKDGRFIRLRNIEFGFNFNKNHLSYLKLNQARIYVVGINLLTWSPLLKNYNLDPETFTGYPPLKSYNIGVSINF